MNRAFAAETAAVPADAATAHADAAMTHADTVADHADAFFHAPEFWVAVAFVVLVALAMRPVFRVAVNALDSRAKAIRNRVEEATRLREQAQSLLVDFERRQREAAKESEKIVARAREDADRMAAKAKADLDASLKRREQQALDRIAQAEAHAVAEVRNMAVDVAVEATRRLLADKVSTQKANALIDHAIKELPGKLH